MYVYVYIYIYIYIYILRGGLAAALRGGPARLRAGGR